MLRSQAGIRPHKPDGARFEFRPPQPSTFTTSNPPSRNEAELKISGYLLLVPAPKVRPLSDTLLCLVSTWGCDGKRAEDKWLSFLEKRTKPLVEPLLSFLAKSELNGTRLSGNQRSDVRFIHAPLGRADRAPSLSARTWRLSAGPLGR